MKKILVIGTTVFLIVSGAVIVFGKKDSNKIDNSFNQNQQIETELEEHLENSNNLNESEDNDNSDEDESDNEALNNNELTAIFEGFADSNSIEIYANGEYQVMRINENISEKLASVEIGETINIIYSNESGSNTIVDLK